MFCEEYIGGGYGEYCDGIVELIRECASKEGMLLDPTYSGKAFFGMNSIIQKDSKFADSHVLFWNTGGIFNLLAEIKSW